MDPPCSKSLLEISCLCKLHLLLGFYMGFLQVLAFIYFFFILFEIYAFMIISIYLCSNMSLVMYVM